MNSTNKLKLHIIWDLDGTLIDSAAEIEETIYRSMDSIGLHNLPKQAPFRSGPPLDKVLDIMYSQNVLSAEKKSEVIAAFRKNYDNCGFNKTPPFEGIEDILRDDNYIHHIVTNKPDLATNRILDKLGWKKYFASVITPYSFMKSSDDRRMSKSELFAICMADYADKNFVGIGDMDMDAKAALAVGIPAIGVLWGTGTKMELQICNYLVNDVQSLNIVLSNICN